MSDDLEQALRAFHNKAVSLLPKQPEIAAESGKLYVLPKARDLLLKDIEHLEKSREFFKLVNATRSEFSKEDQARKEKKQIVIGKTQARQEEEIGVSLRPSEMRIMELFENRVKNFFRQSGYYLDIAEGRSIGPTELIGSYQSAFSQSQIVKRYLAPLEFVTFPPEGNMQFDGFSIRSFSASELDQLLNQRVRAIFYPWAKVDTEVLSQYWFIETTETVPYVEKRLIFSPEVKFKYSGFPAAVEDVMRRLVLYDWRPESQGSQGRSQGKGIHPWAAPAGFNVPFVITVSDSLTDRPVRVPELSILARQPSFDPAGEEIGEEPVIGCYVDYEGTGKFKTFVRRATEMLNNLRDCPDEWEFLHVGLGFLAKASASEGLEQLLWHIAAIEAFLGEKNSSTSILTNRLATVLGTTDEERKNIRRVFRGDQNNKGLYDIRSDIVHGKVRQQPKEVFLGHLGKAQELSRKLALWMVNFLHHIRKNLRETPGQLPSRTEMLAVLDMDEPARRSMSALLTSIPEGFPHVIGWQ